MQAKPFFRNALIISAMLIVLLFIFGRPLVGLVGMGYTPEIRSFAETKLVPIDAKGFDALLKKSGNRPTLVFIYASWCPHCKAQFPALDALESRYPEKDLHITYISLDQNEYELSKFLTETTPKPAFIPYHVSPLEHQDFLDSLRARGLNPNGSIPYLIVFDRDQKPLKEMNGRAEIPALLKILRPLF